MVLRVVQVVIRHAETVVAGAQGPVPVLVFRTDVGVQLDQSITGKLLHVVPGHAPGPVRVVDLHDVGPVRKAVQLELLLGGQERDQGIEVLHPAAPEHQLVELVGAVALLVHIDLEGGVEGMDGDLVVVGEGDNVVVQLLVGVIHFLRPGLALVGREGTLHPRMGMEARPFPAVRRVQVPVRIEDVRTAERMRLAEVVDGADGGGEHRQKEQNHDRIDNLEQDAAHPAQDMSFVCALIFHANLSGTTRTRRRRRSSFRRRRTSPSAP